MELFFARRQQKKTQSIETARSESTPSLVIGRLTIVNLEVLISGDSSMTAAVLLPRLPSDSSNGVIELSPIPGP
jgi:hypothetical protein